VKLQLDEIVDHPDTDLVLRKLEPYLREVSLETVRSGDELVLSGLGPSFRTMNPRDRTVVRAVSQPAATMLHIEANFLASALMGDVAQDEIVRSKIERALESLKAELHLNAAPNATPKTISDTVSHRSAFTATSSIPAEPIPTVEAAPVITPVIPVIATIAATVAEATALAQQVDPEPVSSLPVDHTPEVATTASAEPEPKEEPELKPKPEPEPEQEPKQGNDGPVLTPVLKPVLEPLRAAPLRSEPVPSAVGMEAAPPARKKRSAVLLLVSLLILVLVAAGYFLHRRRFSQELFASTTAAAPSSAAAQNKAAAPAPSSAASSVASGQTAPAALPTDIKAWVQVWAAAISTRDVQYQLSFYATPLDRYFLASDVSREQLLKDKQAEIDDRKGTWTLKAEDVDVQKETATNAVVMLMKHIVVELPSSTVREQRLKTQLKLKMVDGGWKITSERIIG